ncbi:MAG: hypothetical protein ACYC61_12140 [Isosphaeraceae bacterium]
MRRVRFLALAAACCGCSDEPTPRQVKNARAFEALLTAVSLRNAKEFEQDARLIDQRHDAGEISDSKHRELAEIIEKGRAGDWGAAERRAYEFRAQFGDSGSLFD